VAEVADTPVPVDKVIVTVDVDGFWVALLSFAITVMMFGPGDKFTVVVQLATPVPAAVSPDARTPLTVTEAIPLSPRPESVAVPVIVIELAVTVWLWVVIESNGGMMSPLTPVATAVRKFETIVLVVFNVDALSALDAEVESTPVGSE